MITEKMIEAGARAIVGDERYDALPERATYMQRKSNAGAEWWDREELRDTARTALEAAERAAWRPVEEASKDGSRWLAKGTYGDRIIEWDLTEKKWKSVNSDEWFGNSAFDLVRPLPSPPEAPKGEE